MDLRARRVLGSAAIAITTLIITPSVLASDTCVQTRVTDSFISPDGKNHGPGVVKVCPYWTISPSFRLNKVSFNGIVLGVWMTRSREGGKLPDTSTIELRHLPEGRIALADHYWPGRDGRPVAPGLRAANDEASAIRDPAATVEEGPSLELMH